jgi:hypothetical protein
VIDPFLVGIDAKCRISYLNTLVYVPTCREAALTSKQEAISAVAGKIGEPTYEPKYLISHADYSL